MKILLVAGGAGSTAGAVAAQPIAEPISTISNAIVNSQHHLNLFMSPSDPCFSIDLAPYNVKASQLSRPG